MRAQTHILLILCCLCAFAGCKKDTKILPLAVDTYDFECSSDTAKNYSIVPEPAIPYDVYIEGWKYYTDVIPDPFDRNIIYFTAWDSTYPGQALKRYDRKLKTITLLDWNLISGCKINSEGWIVYYKNDFNIYKIKGTGAGKKQLTNDNNAIAPFWSADGKFIYYNHANGGKQYKMSENGIPLDTLQVALNYANDSLIVYGQAAPAALIQKNIHTQKTTQLLNQAELNLTVGIEQFFYDCPNKTIYWGANDFYKKDLKTGAVTPLFVNAKSSRDAFHHFTQSPVTKTWFCVNSRSTLKNPTTLYGQSFMWEFKEDFTCRRPIKPYP